MEAGHPALAHPILALLRNTCDQTDLKVLQPGRLLHRPVSSERRPPGCQHSLPWGLADAEASPQGDLASESLCWQIQDKGHSSS